MTKILVQVLVLLSLVAVALAAPCARTRAEPPSVTTLMASLESPETDAWIVSPDCSIQELSLQQTSDGLTLTSDVNYERVVSVPSKTQLFTASLSLTGADLSSAKALEKAYFTGNPSIQVDAIKLPSTLSYLQMTNDGLSSLKSAQWPAGLKSLVLSSNKLKAVDFAIPSGLQLLDLRANPITKFDRVALPDTLTKLDVGSTSITVFRGIQLPASLKTLSLDQVRIGYLDLRASDFARFETLTAQNRDKNTVVSSSCDPSGRLEVVNYMTVCVVSDDRFEQLYGYGSSNGISTPQNPTLAPAPSPTPQEVSGISPTGQEATPKPTTAKPSSNAIATSSSEASSTTASLGSSGSKDSSEAPKKRDNTTTADLGHGSIGTTSNEDDSEDARRAGRAASPSLASDRTDSNAPTTSSLSDNPLLLVVVIVGGLVVFGVIVISCRVHIARKQKLKLAHYAELSAVQTPDTTSSGFRTSSDAALFSDKALLRFYIDTNSIKIGSKIARGGHGEIFRGVYVGRDVAIKQLAPGSWRDEQLRGNLENEIRLSARLEHPRIVCFIGVTKSSRNELSVILEFMAGGDLHSLLRANADSVSNGWLGAWTMSMSTSKASIAKDVAEALTYLHSFNTPVLHRDVKARNVLLDKRGNAKLGDFGVSRELQVDETMTAEIGTTAWIAPEVLRGERYGEKADVYSFGVLLVEMDTCRHPFTGRFELDEPSATAAKAEMVVAVSTGLWRPSVSSCCPPSIRELAEACLELDANTRPTAMELFYALRQLENSRR